MVMFILYYKYRSFGEHVEFLSISKDGNEAKDQKIIIIIITRWENFCIGILASKKKPVSYLDTEAIWI